MRIEELINENDFNIFTNPQIEEGNIKYLAKELEKEKIINLTEFLDMTKCSTKFCWGNFLSIIKSFSYKESFRGMGVLFSFLQDTNWPVYDETVSFLCSFNKRDIFLYIIFYLKEAYKEDDEIWKENIFSLADMLGIEKSELEIS